MTHKEQQVWAEMARRKVKFHSGEKWNQISLWGLFPWGMVSKMIKDGKLRTTMSKENKTIWVTPTEESWENHIKPLIETKTIHELTIQAGF